MSTAGSATRASYDSCTRSTAWRSAKRRPRSIERDATAVTRWSVFRRTVATKSPAIVPGASTPQRRTGPPRRGGTRTAGNHRFGVVTLTAPCSRCRCRSARIWCGRTGGDDRRSPSGPFSSQRMRSHVVPRAGIACDVRCGHRDVRDHGALTASGSLSENAWLEVSARALTVAAPIGVGIFALHRPPFERFGTLLIVAGCVWFLTTLTTAGDATVYSFGRLAQWGFEPALMYCLLAFPTGRLESRFDLGAGRGRGARPCCSSDLPTALLVERYPVPAPWVGCVAGCPANAFMISGSEPAFIADVVRPLREVLTIVLFAAASVRLATRSKSSEQAQAARARARAGRRVLPLRRLQRRRGPPDRAATRSSSTCRCGWSRSRCRSPRSRSSSACCAGGCTSRVRRNGLRRSFAVTRLPIVCGAPWQKRSTTRRWKSCTGWATARATGVMQTATRSIRRRPRTAAPSRRSPTTAAASRRSSTTQRSRTSRRSSTRRPRTP